MGFELIGHGPNPSDGKREGPFNPYLLRTAMDAKGIAPYKLARACKVPRELVISWMTADAVPCDAHVEIIVKTCGMIDAFYFQDIQPSTALIHVCGSSGCRTYSQADLYGKHPDVIEVETLLDELHLETLSIRQVRELRAFLLRVGVSVERFEEK